MFDYLRYLRTDKLPHIWCPGCGHGSVLKSFLRAVHSLKIDKNKLCVVSGIGCSSRTPGYLDCNTLHTTHGRSLTFATGIKMARPELTVVCIAGDGDATAIGGNHFIHAARRNIDITLIVENNMIYGMTGGQASPTTPEGAWASTAPYGAIDPSFDIPKLAVAAGATFVARGTAFHSRQLDRVIQQAIKKNGFSVVEALSPCPTSFGRKNQQRSPTIMFEWLKDHALTQARWDKTAPSEREGKFVIGVFQDVEQPEYSERYAELVRRAKEQARASRGR